jgi:hypothetical protein
VRVADSFSAASRLRMEVPVQIKDKVNDKLIIRVSTKQRPSAGDIDCPQPIQIPDSRFQIPQSIARAKLRCVCGAVRPKLGPFPTVNKAETNHNAARWNPQAHGLPHSVPYLSSTPSQAIPSHPISHSLISFNHLRQRPPPRLRLHSPKHVAECNRRPSTTLHARETTVGIELCFPSADTTCPWPRTIPI